MGSRSVSPCRVAIEMLVQMLAAVFELIADEADPIQVNPHGELLVFGLYFSIAGALLRQRLMIERQGQDDIGPDFPGVQFRIEAAKFNGVIAAKKAVKIEEVVSAFMVMSATAFAVTFVPY
jgi:hypothetical protein